MKVLAATRIPFASACANNMSRASPPPTLSSTTIHALYKVPAIMVRIMTANCYESPCLIVGALRREALGARILISEDNLSQ